MIQSDVPDDPFGSDPVRVRFGALPFPNKRSRFDFTMPFFRNPDRSAGSFDLEGPLLNEDGLLSVDRVDDALAGVAKTERSRSGLVATRHGENKTRKFAHAPKEAASGKTGRINQSGAGAVSDHDTGTANPDVENPFVPPEFGRLAEDAVRRAASNLPPEVQAVADAIGQVIAAGRLAATRAGGLTSHNDKLVDAGYGALRLLTGRVAEWEAAKDDPDPRIVRGAGDAVLSLLGASGLGAASVTQIARRSRAGLDATAKSVESERVRKAAAKGRGADAVADEAERALAEQEERRENSAEGKREEKNPPNGDRKTTESRPQKPPDDGNRLDATAASRADRTDETGPEQEERGDRLVRLYDERLARQAAHGVPESQRTLMTEDERRRSVARFNALSPEKRRAAVAAFTRRFPLEQRRILRRQLTEGGAEIENVTTESGETVLLSKGRKEAENGIDAKRRRLTETPSLETGEQASIKPGDIVDQEELPENTLFDPVAKTYEFTVGRTRSGTEIRAFGRLLPDGTIKILAVGEDFIAVPEDDETAKRILNAMGLDDSSSAVSAVGDFLRGIRHPFQIDPRSLSEQIDEDGILLAAGRNLLNILQATEGGVIRFAGALYQELGGEDVLNMTREEFESKFETATTASGLLKVAATIGRRAVRASDTTSKTRTQDRRTSALRAKSLATFRRHILEQNKKNGKLAEAEAEKTLRSLIGPGNRFEIHPQITEKTTFGARRTDILIVDHAQGKISRIEVKSGNAKRSKKQLMKDEELGNVVEMRMDLENKLFTIDGRDAQEFIEEWLGLLD